MNPRIALLLVLSTTACPAKVKPPPPGPGGALETFQCNRCHVAQPDLNPAPLKSNCVGCHRAIHQGYYDNSEYDPTHVARWKKNVRHLREVPSLTNLHKRFRRDWFISFVQNPHDLRPRLEAQMPRLPISAANAQALAAQLYPKEEPQRQATPLTGDLARGRAVLGDKGCMTCHALTGSPDIPASALPVEVSPQQLVRAMAQAPDLRHTRARMTAASLLAWLEDPVAVKPDTHMPRIPMTPAERMDVATFLLEAPLQPQTYESAPERLPPLTREVPYAEVERRVFKKICWHCHSDPVPVGGDGGPGNTGGFGFAGKGIDFSSRAALLQSAKKNPGLLTPGENGAPRLIEHLMLRHREIAGQVDPQRRGMPLGLPPMTLEEIQLVETWIAQGTKP